MASEAASFITGAVVPVDGGCTISFDGTKVQTGFDPASYRPPGGT